MSEDSVEKYGLNPAETMILEDYRFLKIIVKRCLFLKK